MIRMTCWAILLLIPISGALGQETDDHSKQLKVEFKGGTVTEYIGLLNTKFEMVNAIVDSPAAKFQLPPIRLTTDFEGAVMVLDGLSSGSRKLQIIRERALYSNSLYPMAQILVAGKPDIVKVVNAKKLLERVLQDDLLDVVKFGLEFQDEAEQVKLSLHKKTGMLFIKGQEDSVNLALETITQLSLGELNEADRTPILKPAKPR